MTPYLGKNVHYRKRKGVILPKENYIKFVCLVAWWNLAQLQSLEKQKIKQPRQEGEVEYQLLLMPLPLVKSFC